MSGSYSDFRRSWERHNVSLASVTEAASTATATVGTVGYGLTAMGTHTLAIGAGVGILPLLGPAALVALGLLAAAKLAHLFTFYKATSQLKVEKKSALPSYVVAQEAAVGLMLGGMTVAAAAGLVAPAMLMASFGFFLNAAQELFNNYNNYQKHKKQLESKVETAQNISGGKRGNLLEGGQEEQDAVYSSDPHQQLAYCQQLMYSSIAKLVGWAAVIVGSGVAAATFGPGLMALGLATVAATHFYTGQSRVLANGYNTLFGRPLHGVVGVGENKEQTYDGHTLEMRQAAFRPL